MSREERIKELQIINIRKNLCKEWCQFLTNITLEDFLKLEETFEIQNQILKKMDEMKSGIIYSLEDNEFEDIIIENYNLSVIGEKLVYFHKYTSDVGAVLLNDELIEKNLNFIIKESELSDRGCSFFIVSADMQRGICLWINEYEYLLYRW